MAVLGSNCYVFEENGKAVIVFSYDPELGSTARNVVSGCFAYDDPFSGRVILLIVHQGLHSSFGLLFDTAFSNAGK
jgi:hypothetical protein